MIEKHSWYPAFDPINGQQVHVLWAPSMGMDKTASIIKSAALMKECLDFVESLEPSGGMIYTAVNAITAGEFYGSNRNGDYFNEAGLAHEGPDYGYKTFLKGHNFMHHENRDPATAVGLTKAAFWNPKMHRVELVVETDLEKVAKRDPEIAEKLANGDPVDVSMGSKCDFDICSICHNKAATKVAYCEHLSNHMNEVMDDGHKVYAYTPHPKFFDISFVKRGADRTAKVMAFLKKDAQAISKVASDEKESAITKYSPPKKQVVVSDATGDKPLCCPIIHHKDAVDLLELYEPDLPNPVIDKLAEQKLPIVIATLTKIGILLKPAEYQRMILVGAGESALADKAEAAGDVFDTSKVAADWIDGENVPVDHALIDPDLFDYDIARELSGFMSHRSIFEPHLTGRLKTAMLLPSSRLKKSAAVKTADVLSPEILAALGLGYLVYRKTAPEAELAALHNVLKDQRAAKAFLWKTLPLVGGAVLVKRLLEHDPNVKNVKFASSAILAPVAGSYLYGAYARRKAEQGRPISGVEHVFMDHPLPLALAGVYAMTKGRGLLPKRTPKLASDITKSAIEWRDVLAGMASGMYQMRPTAIPGAVADTLIFGKLMKANDQQKAAKEKVVTPPEKREKTSGLQVESGIEGKLIRGGRNAYYARAF